MAAEEVREVKKTTGWVIAILAVFLLLVGRPWYGDADGAVWWVDAAEAVMLAIGVLGIVGGEES
jgi:hypothetical protein